MRSTTALTNNKTNGKEGNYKRELYAVTKADKTVDRKGKRKETDCKALYDTE
jgi:hypothetical protein